MKTLTIKLYSLEELSPKAKARVLSDFSDINTDCGWWDSVYEDAAAIGLKIHTFDIDRGNNCKMSMCETVDTVCRNIAANHGEKTDTYQTMLKYKNICSDNTEELEEEFLKDISKNYLQMLKDQYEYLISDEAIIESIKANEYTFEENGTMRNT